MSYKTYQNIVAIFFACVTFLHALRLFFAWPVTIGTLEIPVWLSWVVVALGGTMTVMSFRLGQQK